MNPPFHYQTRNVAPPFKPFIGYVSYARGRVNYRRERILPTGAPSRLINLGDPFRWHELNNQGNPEVRRDGWSAGQQTRAVQGLPLDPVAAGVVG